MPSRRKGRDPQGLITVHIQIRFAKGGPNTAIAMRGGLTSYEVSALHRLPAKFLAIVASHLEDDESLITAARVCHLWRSTLLSTPHLWSYLTFEEEWRGLIFLERSKPVPVSVDLIGNNRPSETVKKSLKGITDRLIALRAEPTIFLDELLTKPLPNLRILDIAASGAFPFVNRGCVLSHLRNLTNFSFTLRHPDLVGTPGLGDNLLQFLRDCPLLQVAFFSYDAIENDLEFTTEAVSLPFLRSFTHESPSEEIPVGLFNRLSLPPTCNCTFEIQNKLFKRIFFPWDHGFPTIHDRSYLSDAKTIKITFDVEDEDLIMIKVKFMNHKRTKVTLKRLTIRRVCPSLAEVLKGILDFLNESDIVRSIVTLHLEYCPVFPPKERDVLDLPELLREFHSLQTLVFWQCDPFLFTTEGPFLPVASLLQFRELVICPAFARHPQESMELQVLKVVRDAAVSRKDHSTPLKTVSLCFQEAELPSHGDLIQELKSCVGLVKVFRSRNWRNHKWVARTWKV